MNGVMIEGLMNGSWTHRRVFFLLNGLVGVCSITIQVDWVA